MQIESGTVLDENISISLGTVFDLCEFSFEQSEENKIFIVWPTNPRNKAWDFMIFDNRNVFPQLYLYLIESSKIIEKSDHAKLHEEILFDFPLNSFKYTAWSSSKMFFIKNNMIQNGNIQTTTDKVDQIFGLKKIDIFVYPSIMNQFCEPNIKNFSLDTSITIP